VQSKERNTRTQSSYDGMSISKWNLDEQSDHNVTIMLEAMLMAATTFRTTGNTDRQVTHILMAGFLGQLKGWWDNYLSLDQRLEIMNSQKEENGELVEDATNVLIYSILKAFIGEPDQLQENTT